MTGLLVELLNLEVLCNTANIGIDPIPSKLRAVFLVLILLTS